MLITQTLEFEVITDIACIFHLSKQVDDHKLVPFVYHTLLIRGCQHIHLFPTYHQLDV